MSHPKPILTVDIVMLALLGGRLHVALIRRDRAPEAGKWALPGGYIHTSEDADSEAAARRVLKTKIGFEPRHLEQVVTEGNADRDPRGWAVSIVYLALHEEAVMVELAAKRGLQLVDVEQVADLAFDHAHLIRLAVDRLRSKASYTTIVAHLLPSAFTIAELLDVYEAVLGRAIDRANFRRKVLAFATLEPVGVRHGTGRPAQAFRLTRELDYFDRQIA
jgi:ADP-ribose pyrophosphatase YjhB (NUDIX family)